MRPSRPVFAAKRFCLFALAAVAVWLGLASAGSLAPAPAAAEVRFGRNVRIGGHDFSNQTFNSRRRLNVTLYNGRPRREGCHWIADGRGGRTKVCRLQRRR